MLKAVFLLSVCAALNAADVNSSIAQIYDAANAWRNAKYSARLQAKWTKAWEKRVETDGATLGEEAFSGDTFYSNCFDKRKGFIHPENFPDEDLFNFVMLFCRIKEKSFAFPDKVIECLTVENTSKIVAELKRRTK